LTKEGIKPVNKYTVIDFDSEGTSEGAHFIRTIDGDCGLVDWFEIDADVYYYLERGDTLIWDDEDGWFRCLRCG